LERPLPVAVVMHDAQPCCSGLFNDPLAQRRDLGRLSLVLCIPGALMNPGNRLKRLADKLDRALHAGAVLWRSDQCQVRQIGHPVQVGAQDIAIGRHVSNRS
jgi:hypothetical protein